MEEIKKIPSNKIKMPDKKFNTNNGSDENLEIKELSKQENIELANLNMNMDNAKKAFATGAVIAGDAVSGILKIGENIIDGMSWCGGITSEGIDLLIANITGLFSEEGSKNIKKNIEKNKRDTAKFIDEDLVGKLNDNFYNTKFGKEVNDNSLIKYDSDTSKKISEVSGKAGEVAAATGLTILTGGAAAPAAFACVFAPGAFEGIGKQAETSYNETGALLNRNASVILLSGALNGLSWYANGSLGKGAVNIFNDAKSIGFDGIKTMANDKLKSFMSDDAFRKSLLKDSLAKIKKGTTGFNGAINLGVSGMMLGGDVNDIINSKEGFTPKNVGILSAKFLRNLGINVIEDILRDNITEYKGIDIESLNNIKNNEYASTFEDVDLPMLKTKEVGNPKDGMFTIKYAGAPDLMPADDDLMHTDSINEAGDNIGIMLSKNKFKIFNSYNEFKKLISKNSAKVMDDKKLVEYLENYSSEDLSEIGNYQFLSALARGGVKIDEESGKIESIAIKEAGVNKKAVYSAEKFEDTFGEKLDKNFKKQVEAYDYMVEKSDNITLGSDMQLVRGVNFDALAKEGVNKGDSITAIANKLVGKEYVLDGFQSCCPSLPRSELPDVLKNKDIELVFNCDADVKAMDLSKINGMEKEVLLSPENKFVVSDVKEVNNKVRIYLNSEN